MKHKQGLNDLVQNFDYELDQEGQQGHSDKWYDTHVNMLYSELAEVYDTLYVFIEVEKEWEKRVHNHTISYSAIRSVLYYALPYKIIMGLSRIFVGKKEYSLEKTINVISQRESYKENINVKLIIKQIRDFLEKSEMVRIVTEYRDNFFGHLDASCAMSDIRIDPAEAIRHISIEEVETGLELINRLYTTCFGNKITTQYKEIKVEDIIQTFFWIQ